MKQQPRRPEPLAWPCGTCAVEPTQVVRKGPDIMQRTAPASLDQPRSAFAPPRDLTSSGLGDDSLTLQSGMPELQRWFLKVMMENRRASEMHIEQQSSQLRLALEARMEEMLLQMQNGVRKQDNRVLDPYGYAQEKKAGGAVAESPEAAAVQRAPVAPPAAPVAASSGGTAKAAKTAPKVPRTPDSGGYFQTQASTVMQKMRTSVPQGKRLTNMIRTRDAQEQKEKEKEQGRQPSIMDWFMGAPIDISAGSLIFASTLITFMNLQYKGYKVRVVLGLEEDGGWGGADTYFIMMEYLFATLFSIELATRLAYFKFGFLKDPLNLMDATVVIIAGCDTFIFSQLSDTNGEGLIVTRMIRYVKLVRTLRFVRAMKLCHPLRVLIKTIASSLASLFWSMVILCAFMMMGAIFTCQTLQDFILDDGADMGHRLWVERYYGSAGKALWTMFEITFSGSGPVLVRPLVENVSVWYAIFFALYIAGVVFAVIRIITALFLKDTLAVAANDADMMVQTKMKEKAQFAAKLEEVFLEADDSGDGMVSWEEFRELLKNPKAREILTSLEFEIHEVESMFTLLDDGDGRVSFDEFLGGVIRLKGQARSQDVLALLHDNKKILAMIHNLEVGLLQTKNVTAYANPTMSCINSAENMSDLNNAAPDISLINASN